jgi:hypothetical protein
LGRAWLAVTWRASTARDRKILDVIMVEADARTRLADDMSKKDGVKRRETFVEGIGRCYHRVLGVEGEKGGLDNGTKPPVSSTLIIPSIKSAI